MVRIRFTFVMVFTAVYVATFSCRIVNPETISYPVGAPDPAGCQQAVWGVVVTLLIMLLLTCVISAVEVYEERKLYQPKTAE